MIKPTVLIIKNVHVKKNALCELEHDILCALGDSKLWKIKKRKHDDHMDDMDTVPRKKARHGYIFDDFVVDDAE